MCQSQCTEHGADLTAKDAAKDGAGTFIPHVISATMITDRALLAVLENNQAADGSIRIPEALRSAIRTTLEQGLRTVDIAGEGHQVVGVTAFGERVRENLLSHLGALPP